MKHLMSLLGLFMSQKKEPNLSGLSDQLSLEMQKIYKSLLSYMVRLEQANQRSLISYKSYLRGTIRPSRQKHLPHRVIRLPRKYFGQTHS